MSRLLSKLNLRRGTAPMDAGAKWRRIRPEKSPSWISEKAEAHYEAYLSQLYEPSVLDRMDRHEVERIVGILLRRDEYKSDKRYDDCCWEPCFDKDSLSYTLPTVEQSMREVGHRFRWPDNKRFALCLTHDVDHLCVHPFHERWRAMWSTYGSSLRTRARLLASTCWHASKSLLTASRHFPINIWMEAEAAFGFRSTFFFMSGPTAQPHSRDGMYFLDDPVQFEGALRPVREVFPNLVDGGWEVGIHGGIATALDADLARIERLRLCDAARTDVTSGRQHWLTYDIQTTPQVHEAAGIRVDSSLGSNLEPICYRLGTGLPVPMFSVLEDRPVDVLQIPLVMQDNPLLTSVDGDPMEAASAAIRVLESTAARGSMATLLFHNDGFEDSASFLTYKEILAAAHDLGAWGCTANEVHRWFTQSPEQGFAGR